MWVFDFTNFTITSHYVHALFFISNTVKIQIVGNFEISIVVAYFFPKIWHSCCLFQKFPIVVAYFEFCKNHDLISYLFTVPKSQSAIPIEISSFSLWVFWDLFVCRTMFYTQKVCFIMDFGGLD